MFEVIHKAKLKPRHVVKFVGVGRVAASRWLNDHVEPHVQLLPKVKRFLDLVSRAVDEGKLPFPSGVRKQDENGYLSELFRQYLKEEKQGT